MEGGSSIGEIIGEILGEIMGEILGEGMGEILGEIFVGSSPGLVGASPEPARRMGGWSSVPAGAAASAASSRPDAAAIEPYCREKAKWSGGAPKKEDSPKKDWISKSVRVESAGGGVVELGVVAAPCPLHRGGGGSIDPPWLLLACVRGDWSGDCECTEPLRAPPLPPLPGAVGKPPAARAPPMREIDDVCHAGDERGSVLGRPKAAHGDAPQPDDGPCHAGDERGSVLGRWSSHGER